MKISKNEGKAPVKRPKHVPQRSCVGCRQVRDKRDLVRLVLNLDSVEVDTSGRQAGRGVYLCFQPACWELGLKGNRIEHGLRTRLAAENRRRLLEYGAGLAYKDVI